MTSHPVRAIDVDYTLRIINSWPRVKALNVLPRSVPMHPIDDFLLACAKPGAVKVLRTALDTAYQWNINGSAEAVLAAINGGLIGNPQHRNTEPWRNNPEWQKHQSEDTVVWVDAYTFSSGLDEGYLAYMFQPKTGFWLLKSLKRDM